MIALLGQSHPLAGARSIDLRDLAEDRFLLFPRELAPRLYDFMVGLCRHAGFEPVTRGDSFHSGLELQILGDVEVIALAPASVALHLREGIAAAPVADPPDQLETAIVYRTDDPTPANLAFREAAAASFSGTGKALKNAPTSPTVAG